jgi:hypothetical protein
VKNFAATLWWIILALLAFGTYAVIAFAAWFVILLIIKWLKPEWLDRL